MVIERHLISALKTCHRGKAMVLTRAERLDASVAEERYQHRKEFGDLIPGNAADPLDSLVAKEESATFMRMLVKTLSSLEIEVLKRHLAGYSLQETATALFCGTKTVDNALTRVKSKIRRELQKLQDASGDKPCSLRLFT